MKRSDTPKSPIGSSLGAFDPVLAQTANWPAPGADGEFFFAVASCSIAKLYDVLFLPDSTFQVTFHQQRNHTNLTTSEWKQSVHENEVSQEREITYSDNASSVFVDQGYPVYETQQLVSSGTGCYVCYSFVKTPTVPYGDSLEVVVQYCIATCGHNTSLIRVSYHVNYLKPTIMRKFINNGIEVSMRKHFQDFFKLLSTHVDHLTKVTDDQREAIARSAQRAVQAGSLQGGVTPRHAHPQGTHSKQSVLAKNSAGICMVLLACVVLANGYLFHGKSGPEFPASYYQTACTVVSVVLLQWILQFLMDYHSAWFGSLPAMATMLERIYNSIRTTGGRLSEPPTSRIDDAPPHAGELSDLVEDTTVTLEAIAEEIEVDLVEEEFFENERFQPFRGFGSTFPGHLLPTDRGHWSDRNGSMLVSANNQNNQDDEDFFVVAPRAPRGWVYVDDWKIDLTGLEEERVDHDGWSYAFDFVFLQYPPIEEGNKATTTTFVRRRRWTRNRMPIAKLQSRFQIRSTKSSELMDADGSSRSPTMIRPAGSTERVSPMQDRSAPEYSRIPMATVEPVKIMGQVDGTELSYESSEHSVGKGPAIRPSTTASLRGRSGEANASPVVRRRMQPA